MKEFKEYDLVRTLVDKPNAPKGTFGAIVSFYQDNEACEVEVWDQSSYPYDVITYELHEIEKASEEELRKARKA